MAVINPSLFIACFGIIGGEDMPTEDIGNGLIIDARTREKGHKIPHVHAYFKGDKNNKRRSMSISLSGYVINGTLGRGHSADEKRAIKYVKEHAEDYMEYWR